MRNLVQNLVTLEFAPAEYTVMFASQGYCGNAHFCTIEDARADFNRQVAETEVAYKSCKSTSKYLKTERAAVRSIVCEVVFVNIKKDGNPGKIKNTIRLSKLAD